MDGAEDGPKAPVIMAADIPAGFFTFGYFAMKHLVVKAYKDLWHEFFLSHAVQE